MPTIIEVNVQTGEQTSRELTAEELAQLPSNLPNPRIQQIYEELADIDRKSVRSLREGDTVRIQDWEVQAQALRQELAGL